jgi:hypothetical protein
VGLRRKSTPIVPEAAAGKDEPIQARQAGAAGANAAPMYVGDEGGCAVIGDELAWPQDAHRASPAGPICGRAHRQLGLKRPLTAL